MHRSCNLRISKEEYRADIRRLQMVLEGKKSALLNQLHGEMKTASAKLDFETAARLRDEIKMLESLDRRGSIEKHVTARGLSDRSQEGAGRPARVLRACQRADDRGVDIAHLGGGETVASLVKFIDGLPFKAGYRRFRIRDVDGIDDFRSIHESSRGVFKGSNAEARRSPTSC
ncbi:MAG: UvrB/UvrC motif-containing protein [Pirellulaceae bacterium]